MLSRWLLVALVLAGCDSGDGAADAQRSPDAMALDGASALDGARALDGAPADAAPADAAHADAALPDAGLVGPPGVDLLQRLSGLWSGPASETPLGVFPLMNMDIRAAGTRQLFSRFDLDGDNGLRFAFAVEDVAGQPTLVYRNGGYFLGIMRDTRTVLVDAANGRYHFCHGERGCAYLDSVFAFDGADRFTLTVQVRGMAHLRWPARRLEPRELPADFTAASGPHDGPFPPLPSVEIHATWRGALDAPRTVWILLSDTPCGFAGSCHPARVLSVEAPAGATDATLRLDQVHPGAYRLNVILDRNNNFQARLFPDRGDGIAALDGAVTVAPEGTTRTERAISLTVP